MRRALVGIFIILILPYTFAQAGLNNAVKVPLYRGAVVTEHTVTENIEWYLPLDKPQKVNGHWRFRKALDLRGDVSKSTYLIKNHDLYDDIADYYQHWAEQSELELLFSCKNRHCGSSNEWANGHFQVRNLYGLEDKQRYWALQNSNSYIAMYLIERGNGKIYLQVEEFIKQ